MIYLTDFSLGYEQQLAYCIVLIPAATAHGGSVKTFKTAHGGSVETFKTAHGGSVETFKTAHGGSVETFKTDVFSIKY
jgi:hypothetical protein